MLGIPSFAVHAKGNDNWISLTIWPLNNDDSRIVGIMGYHHNLEETHEGYYILKNQIIITNRLVKKIIMKLGVKKIVNNHGQIDIGAIENLLDISDAVRTE